jgi:Cu/Ag efflux protein CusF
MKIASILLAGIAALTIIGSAAFAEDAQTGMVTQLDRLSNTVSIKRVQTGTVGANVVSPAEQFKVKDGMSTENLHAGDRISFSTADKNGVKTITSFKIESTAAR